ncbi:MAG: type II secretion system protein [Planctomycetota bacterium]
MNAPVRRGFTIIELVVTIGIALVVLLVLIPILGAARRSGQRTECLSNARQLAAAAAAFGASNAGKLPENRTITSPGEYVTWRYRFVDEGYATGVWECPLHPEPGPQAEFGYVEDGAVCIGDVSASYALNGHVLWRRDTTDRAGIRADTSILRPSHTILIAETNRVRSDLRVSPPYVANYYGDRPGPYAFWHEGRGTYTFLDGHAELFAFLDTGSPDCRWHNGRDLTDDPFVPQKSDEIRPHDHPDWQFLVPDIYRSKSGES